MNEKQQQLTFDKGITNVPSDALCSDNALEESLGMVYDDGEHRVIQKPVEYLTGLSSTQTLLYVHKLNNVEHYIVRDSNTIKWGTKSTQNAYVPAQSGGSDIVLMNASGDIQITSIGQTLIITDSNGMHHFKFNGSGYDYISYPMPDLGFQAKLVSDSQPVYAANTGDAEGIIESAEYVTSEQDVKFHIKGGQQEAFNNLVVGLYSKNLKEIATAKAFAEPFLIRAALEMYDGSYTYITNPILLWPSVTENTKFYVYCSGAFLGAPAQNPHKFVAFTQMLRLYIRQTTDYSAYSDIIKDVVLFASKPISIYKTSQDQPIDNYYDYWSLGDNVSSNPSLYDGNLTASLYREVYTTPASIPGLHLSNTTLRCLQKREQKAIEDDIVSTSVFYKIASIGINAINGFVDISAYTTQEVTENLITQEFLKDDDYFSRNKLIPTITYAYNSRLNIANVKRGFFGGFTYFMPFDHADDDTYIYVYTFDVTIKTDTGNKTVRTTQTEEVDKQKHGIFFYYPDSRAKHVKIYKQKWGDTASLILDADLKEHPALNGAYYFAGFTPTTDEPTGTSAEIPTYIAPDPEVLYNNVIQSEINNPWVFHASGYHAVSTGEIKGISAITQALSEGQFGAYPLIVFSENGIWAMSVDGTGLYSAIHPMSREVCNSGKSITQTDGAIFFSSNKGLMLIVGSQVKCVSEQLSGRSMEPFANFLKDAVIAYDYRDSLLWIFTNNGTNAWVYSIKSGTFGRYKLSTEGTPVPIAVVNNYPDYLIQNGTTVYSLMNRQDINLDGDVYDGTIITRPMKLENALALKSIMQIHHILQFTPYTVTESHEDPETHETVTTTTSQKGTMTLRIFASNNFDNWVELHSLRGTPWKYYRFRFDFSNMIATDRFAGTMLVTQERRTNKLR